MRIVHHLHHAVNIFFVDDDAGQTEYAPGGIVGMNGHVDIIFVAGGHDALQEIFQIFKELVIIHILVHLKQFFYPGHTLGLPAGHYRAVHIAGDGFEHLLRIQSIHSLLGVSQYGRTIGTHACQLSSGPVKHRHKIVANHVNAGLSQTLQSGDIIVDVFVAVGSTYLDGIVNIYALNTGKLKTCILNFFLQCQNIFHFPGFTGSGAVQSGDHACHAGNLSDLF